MTLLSDCPWAVMLLNFLIATTCTGFTSVAPSDRSLIVIHCESQSILGLRVTGRWHLSSSVQPCPGPVTGDPADEPRGFPDVLENLLSGLSPERGILLHKKMRKGHQDALEKQALVLFYMLGEDVGLPGVPVTGDAAFCSFIGHNFHLDGKMCCGRWADLIISSVMKRCKMGISHTVTIHSLVTCHATRF